MTDAGTQIVFRTFVRFHRLPMGFVTLEDIHEVSLVDALKKDMCHFLCLMQGE